MIVLDASVVVDLLLNIAPQAEAIAKRVQAEPRLAAPHLLDAEVGQVLRRFVRRGEISRTTAESALDDLADFSITRYPHLPLLRRAFELRDRISMYDALYLVLAEALDAKLLTRDAALASASIRARVEVIAGRGD